MDSHNNMTILGWIFMIVSWTGLIAASVWAIGKAMSKKKGC